jgi:hypothetical protein
MFAMNRRHRRHNPHRRHHRRNPSFGGFSLSQVVELGVGAAGGVIGAGYLAQLALGANNVGVMGYAAELVATFLLAWGTNKFLNRSKLAEGVIAGGVGGVFKRFWDDNVSGASQSMSGLGNRSFAGLGYYTNRNFVLPTSTFTPGAAAVPSVPVTPNASAQVVLPSTPVSPSGGGAMHSSSKRFGGRFN